jgi:HD-GYP domain-containing protein (c-di-GMP phosphodiesterase class II)
MITGSPTRRARSPEEALTELRTGEGEPFDADILGAFEKGLQDIQEERAKETME